MQREPAPSRWKAVRWHFLSNRSMTRRFSHWCITRFAKWNDVKRRCADPLIYALNVSRYQCRSPFKKEKSVSHVGHGVTVDGLIVNQASNAIF
jgi:hypothetical protein